MIEKVTLQTNSKWELELAHGTCGELNPKALMLYSAAKCAGLTVLHLLKKERVEAKRFEITVTGDMSTDIVQAETVFRSFNVIYNVECARYEDQAKAGHAVNLAHDKYCGLVQMLRKIAPVTHEVAVVSTQPAKV